MLKYLRSKTSTTISLIIVFLFSMTGTVFGKASTPPVSPLYDYVSLGDSLAAGQTPYLDPDSYGYSDILADKLASAGVLGNYGDYGVSGYTTSDVIGQITIPAFPKYNPEIYPALTKAQIVTLDVGANDILGLPAVKAYLAGYGTLEDAQNAVTPEVLTGVASNIGTIIFTIKTANPSAKIYVMGYYNAFPNNPELSPIIEGLNTAIKGAVVTCNSALTAQGLLPLTTYIDTMSSMNKHLTKYIPNNVDIHPTVQGYRAIAQDFWTFIQPDFLRGLN